MIRFLLISSCTSLYDDLNYIFVTDGCCRGTTAYDKRENHKITETNGVSKNITDTNRLHYQQQRKNFTTMMLESYPYFHSDTSELGDTSSKAFSSSGYSTLTWEESAVSSSWVKQRNKSNPKV